MNKKKSKPLVIVSETFRVGGVETYIRDQIEALTSRGREVHLVCGTPFDETLLPKEVASVTSGLPLGPEASVKDLLESVECIRSLVRRHGAGAIHAHPFTSMLPALICAEQERIPLVVTLHGPSSVTGSYGPTYDFLQSTLVLQGASLVLAVSEETRKLAEPFVAPGKLRILPNAFKVSDVPAVDARSEPRWLVVSRLDTEKAQGIAEFINAAHDAGIPGVCVCGPGEKRDIVDRLSANIPHGFVDWLGPRQDVTSLMRAYAGVAGMGRVALEALLADVPVCLIGYDGIKGMLTESLYRLAEPANFSGRGLANLEIEEAAQQLRTTGMPEFARLRSLVISERNADVLWNEIADELDELVPAEPGTASTLFEQLSVDRQHDDSSVFWSSALTNLLGRLVAARAKSDLGESVAFAVNQSQSLRSSAERLISLLQTDLKQLAENSVLLRTEVRHGAESSLAHTIQNAEMIQQKVEQLDAALHEMRNEFPRQLTAALSEVEERLKTGQEQTAALFGQQLQQLADATLERLDEQARRSAHQDARHTHLESENHRLSIELDRAREEVSEMHRSTSWTITKPVRFIKRLATQPRVMVRHLLSGWVPKSDAGGRNGKVRSAFNFIRRTVTHGRIDPSDRATLAGIMRRNRQRLLKKIGVGAALAPAPASRHLPDVYVWAVIDWHFRFQRPQHLATALAKKGHRVFYISNNFVDSTTPGFATEDLGCEGRLIQVNLHVAGAPQIYASMPSTTEEAQIRSSLQEFVVWARSRSCISLVQHPYWLTPARCLPNSQLVYDCMDHHGGFENNASSILHGERVLISACDLLVVTSQWLLDELDSQAKNICLIRNATEYSHFCNPPNMKFEDPAGRKVIGYYGAIAEWFDVALVKAVAQANPEALVLLVGRDTANAAAKLSDVNNVMMVGEVPYGDLPYWLYGFDVCLLPFCVTPLTLATNPVKVYEYLSAGLPVVSVDLPEIAQFEGLVEVATTQEKFVATVQQALKLKSTSEEIERRKQFASVQTWDHRAASFDEAIEAIREPAVSVVVLTYNNLEYTKQCLQSIEDNSDYSNLEVIVVDNASSDGSPEFLAEWARQADARFTRKFIANATNLGFSAGNNVGLVQARGEYLVVLNNDTYVTPGWIRTMAAHLRRNAAAGLVGPVTNNIGNEAKIDVAYQNMQEMLVVAGDYTRRNAGVSFQIGTAAFFCVMLTREAYERVGGLDERFGVGFFEDDDYCRRLEEAGFQVICAEDVFVHHHLSASFNKLKAEQKQMLFERNKALYEEKWGPWHPHSYRQPDVGPKT